MIREDRELLTELARLNTAMAPLALCIVEGTASAAEQHDYALRLIAAGEWLLRRADGMRGTVIEGEVLPNERLTLIAVEPPQESLGTRTTSDPSMSGRGRRPGRSPATYRTPLSGDAG